MPEKEKLNSILRRIRNKKSECYCLQENDVEEAVKEFLEQFKPKSTYRERAYETNIKRAFIQKLQEAI